MTSRWAFSPAGDGIRVISRIKTSFTPLQATHIPTSLFLAGLFLLISVTMVTYAPSLKMGFRAVDDYTYLNWAGRLPLDQYLSQNLDPRVQAFNYRPIRRLLYLIEYTTFGTNAAAYHLLQLLLHFANSLLVLYITWQCSHKWRVAFLAALLFAGFPTASEAVLWISDEAVLAALFSLGSIAGWVWYLQKPSPYGYVLTISALVLALLTKESAAVVPLALFLVDAMVLRDRVVTPRRMRRYAPIAVILLLYLMVEYVVQRQSLFVTVGGYSFGSHVVWNYAAYLAMLVFPWGLQHPSSHDVLVWMIGVLFCVGAFQSRNSPLRVIVLFILLGIGPVVFTSMGAGARYLYLATVPWSLLLAIALDGIAAKWRFALLKVMGSFALTLLVLLNGSGIAEATAEMSELSRQARIPFSDVVRQHASFPGDTRLFFIEPPDNLTVPEISGFFLLRYGKNVSVGGTYADGRLYTGGLLRSERARLQEYKTAFVYYFDDANRPVEVPVDREASTVAAPALPQGFKAPIQLEGYEVTSNRLVRGNDLVLLLYWRATGGNPKDYTVFVHLVDDNGQIVASTDGMPRNGKERTSEWKVNQFTADGHVLRIPKDTPVGGGYRLEVGLYFLPTLDRLALVDSGGSAVGDMIVIRPFEVVE